MTMKCEYICKVVELGYAQMVEILLLACFAVSTVQDENVCYSCVIGNKSRKLRICR